MIEGPPGGPKLRAARGYEGPGRAHASPAQGPSSSVALAGALLGARECAWAPPGVRAADARGGHLDQNALRTHMGYHVSGKI